MLRTMFTICLVFLLGISSAFAALTPEQAAMAQEAERLASSMRYSKAAKLYKKLGEQLSADYELSGRFFYRQAECLFLANKPYKALAAYKSVVKKYRRLLPMDSVYERLRQLSNNFEDGKGTFLGLSDPTSSIDVYRFFVNDMPANHASLPDRYELCRKFIADDLLQEAVDEYQKIIKMAPNEPRARYELAELLMRLALVSDGDGRIGKAASREAQAFLDLKTGNEQQEADMRQVIQDVREAEASRIVSLAEYYLHPRHLKKTAARRYLLDVKRDFSDTKAAGRAHSLLLEHFKGDQE